MSSNNRFSGLKSDNSSNNRFKSNQRFKRFNNHSRDNSNNYVPPNLKTNNRWKRNDEANSNSNISEKI